MENTHDRFNNWFELTLILERCYKDAKIHIEWRISNWKHLANRNALFRYTWFDFISFQFIRSYELIIYYRREYCEHQFKSVKYAMQIQNCAFKFQIEYEKAFGKLEHQIKFCLNNNWGFVWMDILIMIL